MNILAYAIGYDLLEHYRLRRVDKDIKGQYMLYEDWVDKTRKIFTKKTHLQILPYVIVRTKGRNIIISSITEEKSGEGFNEMDFGSPKEEVYFEFECPEKLQKCIADSTWYKNIYDYVALTVHSDGNLIVIPDGKSLEGNLLIEISIVEPVKHSFYIQLSLWAGGFRSVRKQIRIAD